MSLDVLPMSIGVSSSSGKFVPVVPRNANIPCTMSKIFFTAVDNQKGITVEMYEGENVIAVENQFLTRFTFPIPQTRQGPAGSPVTVIFSVGAGGMIQVKTDADEETEQEEMKRQMLLIFFIFILMGMLFFLRMNPDMFQDKIAAFEAHRQSVDVLHDTATFDEFAISDAVDNAVDSTEL